jgi:hypothetical protein
MGQPPSNASNVAQGRGPLWTPQAIVLSDQNFPSILPVTTNGSCLKIVRIENGGLLDLVEELQHLVGNQHIPPGSIVLIFSSMHLSKVGLSAYVKDHVEAIRLIQGRWG